MAAKPDTLLKVLMIAKQKLRDQRRLWEEAPVGEDMDGEIIPVLSTEFDIPKLEQRVRALMWLIEAQRGDEHSHRLLVDWVSLEFQGMVHQCYTADPIMDWEDIKQEWYWSLWRAVSVVDHRGDPIYHLAQRGQWAVRSVIKVANRRRHDTLESEGGVSVVSIEGMRDAASDRGAGFVEIPDESTGADSPYMAEISENRREAKERLLEMVEHADLRPRHHDIIKRMIQGELDLEEVGARRELAREFNVSPQRITQVIQKMFESLVNADRYRLAEA